jgi:hypothetical protein
MDLWRRSDEALEAVLSLEMVCEQLPKAATNPDYWKWVVIALHNALQGYMVLALKGPDGLNVLNKESAKEWKAACKSGSRYAPERWQARFLKLYERIQEGTEAREEEGRLDFGDLKPESGSMMMYMDSRPFRPVGTQDESVTMLNYVRNEFIHFLPQGLSVEVSGLPRVVADCIDIISFLAFDCNNVVWYDPAHEDRTRNLIAQVRDQLGAM